VIPYAHRLRLVQFFAPGVPYPKGSYAPIVVAGRLVTKTDKNLEQWNSLVRAAARRAWSADPVDAPLAVHLEFVLPRARGKSPASLHPFPDVAPDIDKLTRAVLDAMIGIVYRDDARILGGEFWKRWPHAEETTGVLVTVEKVVSQLSLMEV
jgi:Holliday junction resolvase RusA-like endonuclease